MHKFITRSLILCSTYLSAVACEVEGEIPSGIPSAVSEGEDWSPSEAEDSEHIDWNPDADIADASRPAASGLYCGFICPPHLVQTGIGCSTGCAQWGQCPNAVSCQALPPLPPKAAIWGTPEKVIVVPQTLGKTKICWDTKGLNYPVWIRVRVDNGPGQLFTKESDSGKDCEDAPWIQAGKTYKFRVHDDNTDASPSYATGTVVGVAGSSGGGGDGGGMCGSCPSGNDCHCGDVCRPINTICP